MAGMTTQDVLAKAGRAGWTVVSIQAGMEKNPIPVADWGDPVNDKAHVGQPYPAQVPSGKYIIQVQPPAGSNLPAEAQNITVEADPGVIGQGAPGADITPYFDFYTKYTGKDPNTAPVWKPGSVTAPEKPPPTPTAPTAAEKTPSPFVDWKPISDQTGRKGMQDPKTGAIEWSPTGAANQPTLVHASDGVYSIDYSSGQPVATRLPGVPGTRDPAQDAQANAAAAASNASAASTAARTPSEIAAAQASANASNASARRSDLEGQLAAQRAALDDAAAPGQRAQVQANIDRLNAEIANLNKPSVVSGGTSTDRYLGTMAADGTFTWTKNENYNAPKPTLESGYQNQAKIPQLVQGDDGKWTVQWIDNQGRPTVPTDTLQGLAQQIGVKLADGTIPLDDAKGLFDMAHQVISDQTARQQANNQGGQIGAGLLQNRASNVAGQENTLLGLANNKNFGLGGPLPPGLWAGVHNEVMGNMTQAGGGQQVYDTAAALVNRANPQLASSPAGPQAISQLAAMLQVHQQATGEQHPAAAAVQPTMGTPNNPNGDGSGFQGNRSGTGGNGVGVANTPFQAPTTTIAPDGTVTIQHTPGQDSGSSSSSAFRAPVMAGVM